MLLVSHVPAGLAGRHRRPVASPRSSRTWRSATTSCTASGTGCATRRSTPPPGSGTYASPAEQWKHSHNELHHTYTNVIGKDNDLGYGIMRVDEDQRWHPMLPRASRCGTSSTPASSSTASRPTTSSSARTSRRKQRPRTPEFQARAKAVLRQDPQPGAPRTTSSTRCCRGPSFLPHARRELHRQPGPQPVDPLGDHVRPLPRGRRDLREDARSRARPAASGTCARCSARPTSPARKAMHLMTGNLSHQIEHHLFPDLPSNRYDEIAPKVQDLFERYGLDYCAAPAAAAGRLAPGTRWSGCRCPTAGSTRPTRATCPASSSGSTR